MLKDVISVLIPCLVGTVLLMLSAEFVRRLGKHLPPDPEILSANARVTGKRDEKHLTGGSAYFVTFQISDGERMELKCEGEQYGLLAEGDEVDVTWQQKKLVAFNRLS